jgi:hypothetical protein
MEVATLAAALALFLAGCREGGPGRGLPGAEFVDLYVELKLASVVFANDVDKVNETRRVILAQHGLTPSDFHARYVRLMGHPEAWRSFQERVIAKVDEYQVSRKGDTANGK